MFGGLFLAFPRIFPASATLIEKHERDKKQQGGIFNSIRARQAAAPDAKGGAALASLGLALFAWVVWKMLPGVNPLLVLPLAPAAWLGAGILLWRIKKKGSRF